MMRLGKVITVCAMTLVSVPAVACDMHGPNGMFWTPMSHWQNFSPKVSTVDPAFFGDDEDPAFLGDTSGNLDFAAPPPPRVRPSFSSAADKASRAAKTRVMMARNSKVSDDQVPLNSDASDSRDTALSDVSSDTDTQSIR